MTNRPAKKVTKERGIGEALNVALPRAKDALSYVPLPSRTTFRHPKMFGFSGVYQEKTCKFLSGRCSKIGTFLDTGRRCGGGFQRGRIFVAPLWLASFGSFLASQEKNISPPSFLYKKIYVFVRPILFPFPKAGTFYKHFPPLTGFPGVWPVRIR